MHCASIQEAHLTITATEKSAFHSDRFFTVFRRFLEPFERRIEHFKNTV
jgi:hypothetical protein